VPPDRRRPRDVAAVLVISFQSERREGFDKIAAAERELHASRIGRIRANRKIPRRQIGEVDGFIVLQRADSGEATLSVTRDPRPPAPLGEGLVSRCESRDVDDGRC